MLNIPFGEKDRKTVSLMFMMKEMFAELGLLSLHVTFWGW